MVTETKKLSLFLTSLTILFSVVVVPTARAESIIISGNGAESVSSVESSSSNTTNVNSSNNADVNNDIDVDGNTGENNANDNTGGEANITTGDVDSSVDIENSLNTTTVSDVCCDGGEGGQIEISGNGSNSNNSVNYSNDSNSDVNVNNTANVTNNITTNANTGNNNANDNLGNVNIKTGDITSRSNVLNSAINLANVALFNGSSEFSLKISGNGFNSTNSINLSINNSYITIVNIIYNIYFCKNISCCDFYISKIVIRVIVACI